MSDPNTNPAYEILRNLPPINEEAPALHLKYVYNFDFPTVTQGFFRKYLLEPRTQLTTFAGVQQVDEDTVQFYRRTENIFSTNIAYERVTMNRTTQKITSEVLAIMPDGSERVFERGTIASEEG